MDAVLHTAERARHVCIDLHDDLVRHIADRAQMGRLRAKAEIAVFVHRRNLKHGNVDVADVLAVEAGQLGITHGAIEARAGGDKLALNPRHVPGVPGHVRRRVVNLVDRRHFFYVCPAWGELLIFSK